MCLSLFKQGMGMIEQKQYSISDWIDRYHKNYSKYYSPYFLKHSYLLENFCLYYFQHVLFPYDKNELSYRFLFFTIEMMLLKFLLVGISGTVEGLHPTIIIQVFQSYFKLFHHNRERYEHYIGRIHTSLREHTIDYKELLQVLISAESDGTLDTK
ncbi:hypothetical protein [Bacillus cereus]|uniref:hypothetical protein n=1 Tax=Bacillus cereus TaxID=1396 RepID=UPI0011501F8F|nr:hypothetical protein [Bacillus cereus]